MKNEDLIKMKQDKLTIKELNSDLNKITIFKGTSTVLDSNTQSTGTGD